MLSLVLFCIWVRPSQGVAGKDRSPDAIEFVSLSPATPKPIKVETPADEPQDQAPLNPLEIPVRPVLDRVTKQCEAIRLAFRLSDRETEVMEHIARGDTVARIAEKLGVSENTVRTHTKRVYTKLGIHSKQELGDLVQSFEPLKVR